MNVVYKKMCILGSGKIVMGDIAVAPLDRVVPLRAVSEIPEAVFEQLLETAYVEAVLPDFDAGNTLTYDRIATGHWGVYEILDEDTEELRSVVITVFHEFAHWGGMERVADIEVGDSGLCIFDRGYYGRCDFDTKEASDFRSMCKRVQEESGTAPHLRGVVSPLSGKLRVSHYEVAGRVSAIRVDKIDE